jgi:hypothetical protein
MRYVEPLPMPVVVKRTRKVARKPAKDPAARKSPASF